MPRWIARPAALLIALTTLTLSPAQAGSTAPQKLDADRVQEVSNSKYWHRLLHYHSASFLRGIRSQVDGSGFFFSPEGYKNPKAELIASAEAFSKNIEIGRLKQHPQCAFPERYRYIKEALQLDIVDVPCPKLDEFLARFNPESVTLVFSSAYPNNPGSMFGHTFLRINSRHSKGSTKFDLLDQGISFAANVGGDENGFAFAVLGMTGGYPGLFSMVPYYAKVAEYVNSESRDIWEYDLDINREETLRMLRHAWEIETNSYFDYYFLDENCASQLLALIEIAKPEWKLTDFGLYVIPAETIKTLADIPGAITQVKFRPSLRKKMIARVDALDDLESAEFFDLVGGKLKPEGVTNAATLDAAMAYSFYSEKKDLLGALRLQRAKTRQPADESMMVFDESSRPEFGHFPSRFGTSTGVAGGRIFQDLRFKIAFHDVMNQDTGYIPFSQIDFPSITLRYLPQDKDESMRSKLRIEEIRVLALTSLFPLTFIEKRTSWKFELSWKTPKDLLCDFCHVAHFEGGAGASFGYARDRGIAYAMAMGQVQLGDDAFRKGYRLGPKLQVATLFVPQKDTKIRLAWNWIGDLAQSDRQRSWHELEFDQSYAFNRSWEVRGSWLRILRTEKYSRDNAEAKLTLNYYF